MTDELLWKATILRNRINILKGATEEFVTYSYVMPRGQGNDFDNSATKSPEGEAWDLNEKIKTLLKNELQQLEQEYASI